MVFAISANTKYPKEAVEFLSWFLESTDAVKATGMVRGMFPSAKLRDEMAPFMTKEDMKQARVLTLAGSEGKTYRGKQPLAAEEYEGVYAVEKEKLAFGQVDLKEFLQNVVTVADPILKE